METAELESRELSVHLTRVADALRDDFARAVEPLGLTGPMARVLLELTEPRSMREVAARLHCDASYVTGVAKSLQSAGLVTRNVGADRRTKLLTPTEEGARLREAASAAVLATSRPMTRLSPRQREQLGHLVRLLLAD